VFTGIIRELGRVEVIEAGEDGLRLSVRAPETAALTRVGDSVAVNGVCLTAVTAAEGVLAFDTVPETLRRTSLGRLAPESPVNVEPALRAGEPLGGHLVQGHVDGLGRVLDRTPVGQGPGASLEVRFGIDPALSRYVVVKGSVAVDGVSLTVTGVGPDWFSVALVPHTLAVTTLGTRQQGDEVQLEVDVLAKYVERLLEPWAHPQPEQAGGRVP